MMFFQIPQAGCWIIGHRGAMGSAPENTLASFRRGVEEGADFVECDVHLSRDGEAVVIHDDTVDRTTDGQGYVNALTAQQIKRLDAGAWFGSEFRGERIPTLREVLHWAKTQRSCDGVSLGIIIELKPLKTGVARLVERVESVIQRVGMQERVVVISFDTTALTVLKRRFPHQLAGWLYSRRWARPLAQAHRLGVHALFPRYNRLSQRLMQAVHKAGFPIATWTVNTEPEMKRCLTLGVNAIATNYPAKLHRLLTAGDQEGRMKATSRPPHPYPLPWGERGK